MSSIVSRKSNAAREAALKIKCEQEGFQLLEVSYYFKKGKKKRRVKKKKLDDKMRESGDRQVKSLINTYCNTPNEYTFDHTNNPSSNMKSSLMARSYYASQNRRIEPESNERDLSNNNNSPKQKE